MKFNKSEEMALIKEELLKHSELYDNSVKFLITSSLAVISLGLTINSPILLILVYPLIFLFGRKVFFWRDSIAKKGAYCCVFLEGDDSGLHWETINSLPTKSKKNRPIDFAKDLEINLLLLLNTAVVFLKNFDFKKGTTDLEGCITIAIATLLMFAVGFYFLRKDTVSEVREYWINQFSIIKAEFSECEDEK